MNNPKAEKPKPSKAAQMLTIGCVVTAIAIFQVMAPTLFPVRPGGGINFERTFWAGAAGAVGGLLGMVIGRLVDRSRK